VAQYGHTAAGEVTAALAVQFGLRLPGSAVVELSSDEGALVTVPSANERTIERSLGRVRAAAAGEQFRAGPDRISVTPLVGYAALNDVSLDVAAMRAREGLSVARARLDLVPVPWNAEAAHRAAAEEGLADAPRVRLSLQVLATFALALLPPYLGYEIAGYFGAAHAVIAVSYIVVTLALLGTAISIYAESFAALDPVRPPAEFGDELPLASAVIAAYLPNEQATILQTVRAFLELDYPAGLQIVVAYNTPEALPVEAELARLAGEEERLTVLKIEGSTSKAQNVNAALRVVTGEMIGIFDADHHPAPGSFERAWRWLSNGYGVVQGHCVIRNGDRSWVSRLVAVEFESIYALSHPGRAQLHGFGIFGGSNGYWRAELLRDVWLRGSMLTEDIDSSLRVTLRGQRIASDPGLISRELAPTTLRVLTGQRLRWAQGWSQVTHEYVVSAVRSRRLSLRQKLGSMFLLGWRELYPWLSLQMLPLLAYLALHPEVRPHHWLIPIFVLTTVVTFGAGPTQTLVTYLVAVPEIRERRGWFLSYAVLNAVFYTEFKNTLARVAQLKQLLGEQAWRVTVRDHAHAGAPAAILVTDKASA
jgi:cellulose synthase/poly-beta-1,6-N-acetylglucosamine synthase-like glycosyltransferase